MSRLSADDITHLFVHESKIKFDDGNKKRSVYTHEAIDLLKKQQARIEKLEALRNAVIECENYPDNDFAKHKFFDALRNAEPKTTDQLHSEMIAAGKSLANAAIAILDKSVQLTSHELLASEYLTALREWQQAYARDAVTAQRIADEEAAFDNDE